MTNKLDNKIDSKIDSKNNIFINKDCSIKKEKKINPILICNINSNCNVCTYKICLTF